MSRSVSLVTGAGGAIGREVVQLLLDREHFVAGLDVAPDVANISDSPCYAGFRQRLGDLNGSADLSALPVANHAFLVAGEATLEEAGAGPNEPLSRTAIQATFENNFLSAVDAIDWMVHVCGSAARTITLVSSINAIRPFGLPVYSAMKASLHGLLVSRAGDLLRQGIRLNCVALGTVEHEGVRALHSSDSDHFGRLRAAVPSGKLMGPVDAASAIVTVALDQPTVAGQVVVVDNGQSVA